MGSGKDERMTLKLIDEARGRVRQGAHRSAAPFLADALKIARTDDDLLAIATLQGEIAEHDGLYDEQEQILKPFLSVSRTLETWRQEGVIDFDSRRDPEWRRLRQMLYYQWQRSVCEYRHNRSRESRRLLRIAYRIAEDMTPRSEGLLTQLEYGLAKLEFHDGQFANAIVLYRKSIVNAAAGLATAREQAAKSRREKKAEEAEASATRYSIAKALSLGLGQCMREQGRLDDAHMVAIAGRLLLETSADLALTMHSQQLLASIERGTAGESDAPLLASARARLKECVDFFAGRRGDESFRSRYELALVYMQQGALNKTYLRKALALMHAVLDDAVKKQRTKWIANAYIGLSRILRRMGDFKPAIASAEKALEVAEPSLKKIARRAGALLARTRAEAVFDNPARTADDLGKVEEEVSEALLRLEPTDLRNRLMLYLWKARLRHEDGDGLNAERAFSEYERSRHQVSIRRIHDFAAAVRRELSPELGSLSLPVDRPEPDWIMESNEDAVRQYVVRKIDHELRKTSATKKADILRIARSRYFKIKSGKNSKAEPRKKARARS
jgi:Tetratricopeptide repeat